MSVPQLFASAFERQAATRPSAIAVSLEEEMQEGGRRRRRSRQELSYAGLEERSSALAVVLRGLGVGRDVVVAVRMGRSVGLVVAVLGVSRAGGAFLPVDPHYPQARQDVMLQVHRGQAGR